MRPFIGWVCGVGIAYQFLGYSLLTWLWAVFGQDPEMAPVAIDAGNLMTLVLAMLGVTAARSYDKDKGTDSLGVYVKKKK